ncbi:hypothetical protein [Desulfopila sp. IMCC35006]|uniref:hypothetical protein n=1 Tax=Desulfopila sp. IMCC35006 TaxID=2569542 RepID=UPI001F0D50B9|nr:hypothetical protein [Desulfopila sp. IMCC35006]
MKTTKFSKNLTVSYFTKKKDELQQEFILLLHCGVNHENILVQGSYEPARHAESIFVEPNRKHVRNNLKKRNRSLHAIVSIEAVLDGGTFAGCRFVANNDTFERMTGIIGEQAQGKMVNEIWPNTEVHWIKAYTQLTESGSPSAFTLYHAQISKLYRCHLFNPGQSRSLFFVIFTDITNQKTEEIPLILKEGQNEHLRL